MNSVKVVVVVLAASALAAGCGQKKEEQISLPPEQILTGNAILAPQQAAVEARSVAPDMSGQSTLTLTSQPVEPALELRSSAPEKPSEKDIQQALANAGVYNGAIDGNLGPKSKKAIKLFQEQNGLAADGKVGPRTWKKLSVYLNSAPAADAGTGEIAN